MNKFAWRVIFLLFVGIVVQSFQIEINDVVDSKLCNNKQHGIDIYASYRCFNDLDSTIGPCDLPVYDDLPSCLQSIIEVSEREFEASPTLLEDLILNFDRNSSLRRTSILITAVNKNESGLVYLAHMIDSVLETKPWLSLAFESSEWMVTETGLASNKFYSLFVIDKYRHDYESYLRLLGSIEYLPQATCESNSALIMVTRNTFVHPGWAGVLGTLYMEHFYYRFATTMLYVSQHNDPHYLTGFIDATDCPNVINRWECAFLRTTNCSVPLLITQCREPNCVRDMPSTDNFGVYFRNYERIHRNASTNNLLHQEFHMPQTQLQEAYFNLTQDLPPFRVIVPRDIPWKVSVNVSALSLPSPLFNSMVVAPEEVLFVHQYLLRMRHAYRLKVAKVILDFDISVASCMRNHSHDAGHNNFHTSTNNKTSSKPLPAAGNVLSHLRKRLPHLNISHLSNMSKTDKVRSSKDAMDSEVKAPDNVINTKHKHINRTLYHASLSPTSLQHPHPLQQPEARYFPECIAAHIRRGDRLGHIDNITAFCTKVNEEEPDNDYGCRNIPFASVRLTQVLDVARVMSSIITHPHVNITSDNYDPTKESQRPIRTIFVATDDDEWLQQEIRRVQSLPQYQDWDILSLPINETQYPRHDNVSNSSLSQVNATLEDGQEFSHRRGTAAGVHLLATMNLMQRCVGFIGHFDSSASWMFYQSMCHRRSRAILPVQLHHKRIHTNRWKTKPSPNKRAKHAHVKDTLDALVSKIQSQEGICPMMFDMRHGFEWLTHIRDDLF